MTMNELKDKLAEALENLDLQNLGSLSEEAMQVYPNEGFGYYYFGEKILKDANIDMPTAEWHFAKASYLEQNNITYLKKYAQSLSEQYKYDEAYNVWATVYYLDNNDNEALFGLGHYELTQKNNPSAALQYFASISNPVASTYEGMALAYLNMGDFENALGYIDYALSLGFSIEAALTKIDILNEMQSYLQIPDMFQQILEVEPTNGGFLYEYAKSLFAAKDFKNADEAFQKAFEILQKELELDSASYRPYIENCIECGKYSTALETLDKCIAQEKEADIRLHELRALVLEKSGDTAAALKEWDRIISLYAFNPILQDVASLEKAELQAKTGDIDAAEKTYNAIDTEISKKPKAPLGLQKAVNFGKSLIALQKGDKKIAYNLAAKCVIIDDEKAKSLVNEKLMDYVKSVRQEIISTNSGVSKNSSHPLLKNVIGKAWVFNQFNIKAPESIANDTEKMAEFEKSLADFQEKLGEYVIFIGEKEIYLQLPYSNPKQPVRSMVYAYEIEKEKENLLQIKLIAVDGIDSLSAKLKIGSEGLVLSLAEGEIFKLSEITNLNRISFKIQRNFYRHFGYLNPLKNFEPIAEPEVLEALLDY
jgi:tetratricopeptide (TPR) repeat protein